jgi:formate hydrogenlyase subunit 4
LTALLGLIVNLVAPWGIATTTTVEGLLIGVIAVAAKILLAGAAVAIAEVGAAKVRLFRVPELLAGSFVLAFLAVTASYLVA